MYIKHTCRFRRFGLVFVFVLVVVVAVLVVAVVVVVLPPCDSLPFSHIVDFRVSVFMKLPWAFVAVIH